MPGLGFLQLHTFHKDANSVNICWPAASQHLSTLTRAMLVLVIDGNAGSSGGGGGVLVRGSKSDDDDDGFLIT